MNELTSRNLCIVVPSVVGSGAIPVSVRTLPIGSSVPAVTMKAVLQLSIQYVVYIFLNRS